MKRRALKTAKKVSSKPKPAGAACEECPLREAACVRTERHQLRPKLAIVGEAPGATELLKGRPFIGPSGQLMNKMLRAIGIEREEVLWTNAALCESTQDKELRKAAKACQDRLQRELEGISFVVPVGAYALGSVLKLPEKPRILKWRGFVVRDGERTVMPTVHPAFVLRSPEWREVIGIDMKRIERVMRTGWLPPEKLKGRTRVLVKSVHALRREVAKLERVISLDVETTEEPATENRMICFSMTDVSGKHTVVVPWSQDAAGNGLFFGSDQQRARDIVNDALRTRVSVTHNGPSFDHIVLDRHGIYVGEWEDTLIAHHTFASHMPQRLSHVVSVYIDAPAWKEEREDTIRDLYRYNGRDTLYTALAWGEMQEDLASERKVYDVDRVSSELCRTMQVNGFRYDVKRAAELRGFLDKEAKRATWRARKVLRREINLASHLQLRRAFFETLTTPVFFRSVKTNAPVLDVNTLRAYAAFADERIRELSLAVLDFRKATKMTGTYIDPIRYDADYRVHPSWRSFGTVSGRYACREPNLMNLTRPENDPSIKLGGIRSLYVSPPGRRIVAYDFAQLEMRIAAYASGDKAMISACESTDLHAENAALLFGEAFTSLDPAKDKAEWKKLRTIAKTSGFAIAYMASAPTVHARILAYGLEMSLQQCEALLKRMKKVFHGYYGWQDDMFHRTIKYGYVESPIIRRKHFLGHSPKPSENANFPIQSGAADVMNLTLPKIVDALPKEALLVAQIHDAAMFDVPEDMAEDVLETIKEICARPMRLGGYKVVFPIDAAIGQRWSEV